MVGKEGREAQKLPVGNGIDDPPLAWVWTPAIHWEASLSENPTPLGNMKCAMVKDYRRGPVPRWRA